jgi:hypothetical protein
MCARYEHIVEPVELSRLLRDLARKNIAVEARAALVAPPRSRVAGCRLEPFREAARLQVGAPLTKQEALRSLLLLVVGEKLLREGANLRVGGTTRREACRLCLVNVHGFSDQPRSPRWSRAAPRTVTPPFLRVAPCHTRSSSSPRFPRIVRDPPPYQWGPLRSRLPDPLHRFLRSSRRLQTWFAAGHHAVTTAEATVYRALQVDGRDVDVPVGHAFLVTP